jgi:hypothetical protein
LIGYVFFLFLKHLTFTFNEMEIGIVSEFNYLGVLFSKSGNFSMAKKSHKSYVRSFKKRSFINNSR